MTDNKQTTYQWICGILIVVIIIMAIVWTRQVNALRTENAQAESETSLQAFQRELEEKCNSVTANSGTRTTGCSDFLDSFSATLAVYSYEISERVNDALASSTLRVNTTATTSVSTATSAEATAE